MAVAQVQSPDSVAAPRTEVAAGILCDKRRRVLLAERVDDRAFAGLWEFPGGKIDACESPEAALCRELREELGIEVTDCRHFLSTDHDYSDRRVRLHFYLVTAWREPIRGVVGQKVRWVKIDALDPGQLLPADLPVIAALRGL